MAEVVDKFPTAHYEANDHLICPNGDKVRSDDEGLFCWLEGARVPYPIAPAPVVMIQPVVVTSSSESPTESPTPAKAATLKKGS